MRNDPTKKPHFSRLYVMCYISDVADISCPWPSYTHTLAPHRVYEQ